MVVETARGHTGHVTKRIFVLGEWKLTSPAHFGGEDGVAAVDMCLLRDDAGVPYIPGASIAGALRSYLGLRLLGRKGFAAISAGSPEPAEVEALFGGRRKNGKMSRVVVFDASPPEQKVPAFRSRSVSAVRDGVRLDQETGLAVENAKFDTEVLEPGCSFVIRMECLSRAGDDEQASRALRAAFACVSGALAKGEVRLGARTRRGFGRGRVTEWKVREVDPAKPADLAAWLGASPCPPVRSDSSFWKGAGRAIPHAELLPDMRRSIRIEATLDLETSLLVRRYLERQAENEMKQPDVEQITSSGNPVIPGTSVAGLLRHRVSFVARSLWGKADAAELNSVVDGMFGPLQQEIAGKAGSSLRAGRVWVDEGLLANVESYRQVRVAIDRFTGGAMDHALFMEQPVRPRKGASGPAVTLTAEIEGAGDGAEREAGLLFLAFKDILMGRAPLGGETSIGRGSIRAGTLTVTRKEPGLDSTGILRTWVLKRDGASLMSGDDVTEIQELVSAAGSLPVGPQGQAEGGTQ